MSLLTAIICVPLFAALLTALIPRNFRVVIRALALGASALTLLLALKLFIGFDAAPAVDGFKYNQQITWVFSLGISYHVGVDGINLGLIVMGAIVAFAAACVSWEIRTYEKEYYVLLHVMVAGILGAFASLDLFFFYFFHELALVPTFIMIGLWGRGEDKNYAALKITIYLSLGALIALIGLIMLYVQTGAQTFDIVEMTQYVKKHPVPLTAQKAIFPLLLFGFGILVSLWPFHTWAPIGYGSAPTATSMLHAGVLKKFGLYGIIRIALPLLPKGFVTPILPGFVVNNVRGLLEWVRPVTEFFHATALSNRIQMTFETMGWLDLLAYLCLGNILYCGLVAMRQRNLNFLIGNSSVAHMGFIFLGIASLNLIGVTGAVMIMVAHGLLAALTFGLSGYLYQKTGTLSIDQMGGLMRRLPFIGTVLVMAMLAGCGLPGFANFVGEAMVLFGAFKNFTLVTALATWGALVVGAVYMLRAVRDILHGPLPEKWTDADLPDANSWRKLPFVLLVACLLVLGCWPRLLVDKIQASAKPIVAMASGEMEKPKPRKPAVTPQAPAPKAGSRRAAAAAAGVSTEKR